jgi:hypothetical protein
MSDFEQDFMSKVRGGSGVSAGGAVAGGVTQSDLVEKKSMDKRWFVIGGLILVLVVLLVVLNVISNRGNSSTDDGSAPYDSVVVGSWTCDGGMEMRFFADKTYLWMNVGQNRTEAGNFSEIGGRLEVERTVLNVGGQITSSLDEKTFFRVQRDRDALSILEEGGELSFVCARVENV